MSHSIRLRRHVYTRRAALGDEIAVRPKLQSRNCCPDTSRTEVGSTIVNPPSAGMLAATHKGRDQEVQTCLAFSLASLSLQPFKASWKLRKDKFQLKPH